MTTPITNKALVATTFMLSAAAITSASIYAVWHAGTAMTQIIAWQAMPAGVHIIKKQAKHVWPSLVSRLQKNCPANG